MNEKALAHWGLLRKKKVLLLVVVVVVVVVPVPVAARSKAYVYGRSPAEIVGTNPTGGIFYQQLMIHTVTM